MSKSLIFVLEDNETELETIKMYLQEFSGPNDSILIAKSGEEALRIIRNADPKPGIYIIDLNMPGRTQGKDVLIEMQKYPELNTCAKVVLTSSTNPKDRRECFALGATDFKTKPRLLEETKVCIKGILEKYKDYAPSGETTKLPDKYDELSADFGDIFDDD